MGRSADQIRALGAEVVAIAVTAIFSQQRFAADLGVDFPLLSDWNRQVCAAYGVQYDVWKGHEGLAKRSLFVVDEDGIVRYRWVTDDAQRVPDFDEAIAAMAALRAPTEGTPS